MGYVPGRDGSAARTIPTTANRPEMTFFETGTAGSAAVFTTP
jgi:hypothetical protein